MAQESISAPSPRQLIHNPELPGSCSCRGPPVLLQACPCCLSVVISEERIPRGFKEDDCLHRVCSVPFGPEVRVRVRRSRGTDQIDCCTNSPPPGKQAAESWHSAPQDDFSVLSKPRSPGSAVRSSCGLPATAPSTLVAPPSRRHRAQRPPYRLGHDRIRTGRGGQGLGSDAGVRPEYGPVRSQDPQPNARACQTPPAMNTEIEPLNGEQHKRQRRPRA